MSAAHDLAREVAEPGAAARPPATPGSADAPALPRRFAARLGNEWLPRAAWTISRTGRPGLIGIGLLLAAALFLFSTHLKIASEVEELRADLATAQSRTAAENKGVDPATGTRALPARAEMLVLLRQLFNKAVQARLAVETGKYEINSTASSGVVRYQIAFPVTGPYPQIRTFIDTTLASMPAVALSEFVIDRKSIAEVNVDAQIKMTVYTGANGAIVLPGAGSAAAVPGRQASPRGAATEAERTQTQSRTSKGRPASDRVVVPTQAASLFAPHSWHVAPPPPPAPAAPPPPEPTAPPFPYTFIGSFSPEGHPEVFFLSRGDRVLDARVGDRIDGVYQFESAAGGQLVFVYLPLNTRQILTAGVSQ